MRIRRLARLGAAVAVIVGLGANSGCGGGGGGGRFAAPDAVYVQANSVPRNAVQIFFRSADGSLEAGPRIATGGSGSRKNPPQGLPKEPSRGDLPVSLALGTLKGGRLLLYALNERSKNVSGNTVDDRGRLAAIAGAVRQVSGGFSARWLRPFRRRPHGRKSRQRHDQHLPRRSA